MSRKKTNQRATMAATGAGRRARQLAAQVKPAAAHIGPLAQSTAAAAIRRVRATRAWAAPRVERTGLVLQDSVAPKVAAWLSAAARRLEPAKSRRARWRKLAGVSVLAAAAGAAAAVARNRHKPDSLTSVAEADAGNVAPAAAAVTGRRWPASAPTWTGRSAPPDGPPATTGRPAYPMTGTPLARPAVAVAIDAAIRRVARAGRTGQRPARRAARPTPAGATATNGP